MSSSGIDKILVLSDEPSRSEVLKKYIVSGLKHPHFLKEARIDKDGIKSVKKGDFGLLIILSHISNKLSIDAARFATNHPTATIIYIASETDFSDPEDEKNRKELLEIGANLLIKPVSKNSVLVALNAAEMAHIRLCTLRQKLEDEKIINRAKLILMEVLCMSEDQAHKYIEKESMNRGVTRVETAYDILRTYDY